MKHVNIRFVGKDYW